VATKDFRANCVFLKILGQASCSLVNFSIIISTRNYKDVACYVSTNWNASPLYNPNSTPNRPIDVLLNL
jgi:hypothetical protein